jgi:hypothetical protein
VLSAAAGGLLAGAFDWSRLAAATDAAASPALPSRVKACIFVFYYGGPSQLETYDPKPNAPAEIRGELGVIQTTVPGLVVSEPLRCMSRLMHKVALVRSVHHQMRLHDSGSTQVHTGHVPFSGDIENFSSPAERGVFPSVGAVVHRFSPPGPLPVSHVALPFLFHNVVTVPCQSGGFLGSNYDPFVLVGDPTNRLFRGDMLQYRSELVAPRVQNRQSLLQRLDSKTKTLAAGSLDRLYSRAYDLLGSESLRAALRIEDEPDAVRRKYDFQHPGGLIAPAPEASLRGQSLLMARRLVEAGVPFVNVNDFRQQGQNWDSHTNNCAQHRDTLVPPADKALAALIEDLEDRGLLDTTLVVAMGEFGRTPRINGGAGRDHWPDCYSAILAGGGITGGTVYGASDMHAAYPAENPVSPADITATIFSAFGIDPNTEIHDMSDRPYRISEGRPITALWS